MAVRTPAGGTAEAPVGAGEALVEDVMFLLAVGDHPSRIALRMGMSVSGVSRALYRYGRPDLARIFACELRREHQ